MFQNQNGTYGECFLRWELATIPTRSDPWVLLGYKILQLQDFYSMFYIMLPSFRFVMLFFPHWCSLKKAIWETGYCMISALVSFSVPFLYVKWTKGKFNKWRLFRYHDLKGKTKCGENKVFVNILAGRYLMLQTLIILKKPKLRKEERILKVNLV